MKLQKFKTISFKLAIIYAVLFIITLIIVSGTTYFSTKYYIYYKVSQEIKNLEHKLKEYILKDSNFYNQNLIDLFGINQNIDLYIVKNGKLIYKSNEKKDSYKENKNIFKTLVENSEEGNLIYFNSSFLDFNNNSYDIQIVKDFDNENNFLKALFWILIIINLIAFFISMFLGFLMSKKVLKPIDNIIEQANKITINDLSKRIKIKGPDDEIKRLSETFNSFISRIEEGYKKQKRFVMDASHELTTPLAVVKGYIDILSRWGKKDPQVLDESINSIKRELDNVSKLIDTLLYLANSDDNNIKIEKSNFYIKSLVNEIIKEIEIIKNKKIIIKNEISENILINADKRLIKQMIRGLIDNSIKYSKDICIINIKGKYINGEKIELIIEDNGIGISKDDIPFIFERFYRADKSRSREIGGFGLGLSIIKQIVEIHGGIIYADSELGKGTKMIIVFPTKQN
ncbi:sensor histidine kinase [Marinitoga aeolica]|uniref:histidine kinase n=1 Tax=Marinitoga aeolica TaxID=2809031 RepID=A0ABY8PSB6_9BACT|nr:HAMP domain-containing sensor histidine kinase [Marinitoga aeolica]WGS65505.1 HAMP domain-containing histidine kinase [Marinitoga aeolica]